MVGQLLYSREKGSSPLSSCRYGPLPVIVGVLHEPENLSQRRLIRRLSRLEKAMAAAGVSRVILPEGVVCRNQLTRLHPVHPLPMYRALADVLAFSPGCPEEENALLLFGEKPRLGGLKLSCFGFDLPESCSQQILSLLWEGGHVDRTALKATICP